MFRNYAGPGLLVLLVMVMFVTSLAQPGSPANGQDGEPIATPQSTPTSIAETPATPEKQDTAGAGTTTGPLELSAEQSLAAVLIFVVLILILTGIVIFWLNRQNERDHTLRLNLIKAGKSFSIGTSSPVFISPMRLAGAKTHSTQKVKAEITGPTTVVIGKPAEFLLKTDDSAEHPVKWSLKDPSVGVISADSNPTRLIATGAGKITVVAEIDDGAATAEFETEALEAKLESQMELPNSIVGWGTMLLAILILCFAALIALLTDQTAAVLTLFGTMAGYAFGVSRSDK